MINPSAERDAGKIGADPDFIPNGFTTMTLIALAAGWVATAAYSRVVHRYPELKRLRGYAPFDALIRPID